MKRQKTHEKNKATNPKINRDHRKHLGVVTHDFFHSAAYARVWHLFAALVRLRDLAANTRRRRPVPRQPRHGRDARARSAANRRAPPLSAARTYTHPGACQCCHTDAARFGFFWLLFFPFRFSAPILDASCGFAPRDECCRSDKVGVFYF